MRQRNSALNLFVILAILVVVGCQTSETSEPRGNEPVSATAPICSQDSSQPDRVRTIAPTIQDHLNYGGSLAPYWPSPLQVVDCMLDLADVDADDVVIDLGSGDGRIVIAAAQRGARGIGIDYNPKRIAEANANAAASGVQNLVTFIEGDIRDADLSEATVVTLYLLASSNVELRPKLTRELRAGARIVSCSFGMGDWLPDRTERIRSRSIHLWHHDGTVRPAEGTGANETQSQ